MSKKKKKQSSKDVFGIPFTGSIPQVENGKAISQPIIQETSKLTQQVEEVNLPLQVKHFNTVVQFGTGIVTTYVGIGLGPSSLAHDDYGPFDKAILVKNLALRFWQQNGSSNIHHTIEIRFSTPDKSIVNYVWDISLDQVANGYHIYQFDKETRGLYIPLGSIVTFYINTSDQQTGNTEFKYLLRIEYEAL
jgi:hypothetical protein